MKHVDFEKISPELRRKLNGLIQLAENGYAGEREKASNLLTKLLSKHNLTISDLESESKELHSISVLNNSEYQLLIHIYCAVLNTMQFEAKKAKKQKKYYIEVTAIQWLEIETRWIIYRRALKKHLDLALKAFIFANNIMPDIKLEGGAGEKPLPEENLALIGMMSAIVPTPVQKFLPKSIL